MSGASSLRAVQSSRFAELRDGTKLAVFDNGLVAASETLVFIHGWSGSKAIWTHQIHSPELAQYRLIAFDLRGHGDSDKTKHGHHVGRLAVDLHEILQGLVGSTSSKVHLIGASLGCAVIWTYVELFGTTNVATASFVDQAPLQNRQGDWLLGSKGCYDSETLQALRNALIADPKEVHHGTVEACMTRQATDEETAFLVQDSMKCDPTFLGDLMADHTGYDHRATLPLLRNLPCLVFVAKLSKVFPPEGVESVARLIGPSCSVSHFDEGSHWLHFEEHTEFTQTLLNFVKRL